MDGLFGFVLLSLHCLFVVVQALAEHLARQQTSADKILELSNTIRDHEAKAEAMSRENSVSAAWVFLLATRILTAVCMNENKTVTKARVVKATTGVEGKNGLRYACTAP